MLKIWSFPLLFLFLFLIKLIIFGTSLGDSVAFLGLSALYGYYLYLESKKQIPINEITLKEIENLKKEISEVKSFLHSNKLLGQFRAKQP